MFHFSLVEGNLVPPSDTGLGRLVGSSGVTQPAHAAACHTAPAIFAKQVNQSLHRKTLDFSSFPFPFFFFPFFVPSPPCSHTSVSGSRLGGSTSSLLARSWCSAGSDMLATKLSCHSRQLDGPGDPCQPRASPAAPARVGGTLRAQCSHKAAGFFS